MVCQRRRTLAAALICPPRVAARATRENAQADILRAAPRIERLVNAWLFAVALTTRG